LLLAFSIIQAGRGKGGSYAFWGGLIDVGYTAEGFHGVLRDVDANSPTPYEE
jgi:hypothetical protein